MGDEGWTTRDDTMRDVEVYYCLILFGRFPTAERVWQVLGRFCNWSARLVL